MKKQKDKEKKQNKVEKKKGVCLIVAFLILLVLFLSGFTVVKASSGLVDETINDQNLYSKYDLDNYQLDFYVDTSWSWLPWNWMDGIGRSVMHGIYCLSDVIWGLSKLISTGTGMVVQEAYRLDFISDLADQIGKNIQTLAGVSTSGISRDGFYAGFLPWIILAVGTYVAYVGLIKRETSKALGALVNMLVIFVITTGFIACAPLCIRNINEVSSDISTKALELGTKLVMSDDKKGDGDSVDQIRDSLFFIQIYQPWLILQYGTSDIDSIGESRVQSLLSVNPEANYGADREAVVITEIETYGNVNMTITNVVKRLGMVLFVFVLNFIISIFVIVMAGMMVLSQVLFIIFVMFLPFSFILSMFPTYGGMAKKAVVKVFNVIMMRAGLTLVVTIAFSISTMLYGLSADYPFFLIAFLQIVVFVGISMKSNELLGMLSLQEDGTKQLQRRILLGAAALPAMRASEIMQYRRCERNSGRRHRKELVKSGTKRAYGAVKNRAEKSLRENMGVSKDATEMRKQKAERYQAMYGNRVESSSVEKSVPAVRGGGTQKDVRQRFGVREHGQHHIAPGQYVEMEHSSAKSQQLDSDASKLVGNKEKLEYYRDVKSGNKIKHISGKTYNVANRRKAPQAGTARIVRKIELLDQKKSGQREITKVPERQRTFENDRMKMNPSSEKTESAAVRGHVTQNRERTGHEVSEKREASSRKVQHPSREVSEKREASSRKVQYPNSEVAERRETSNRTVQRPSREVPERRGKIDRKE